MAVVPRKSLLLIRVELTGLKLKAWIEVHLRKNLVNCDMLTYLDSQNIDVRLMVCRYNLQFRDLRIDLWTC